MENEIRILLMYFVVPVWVAAGLADWFCHRRDHIEHTAGPKESLIHFLMFGEMGVPVLAALFLEINALVILLMLLAFVAHEATSLWDVRYAAAHRTISPLEQRIHSYLDLIPLLAMVLAILPRWGQFLALFGLGSQAADFSLGWKNEMLPVPYLCGLLAVLAVCIIIPYSFELRRGIDAARQAKAPGGKAPAAKAGSSVTP